MVYEKKRSGDPDYDDKQPPEFHAGGTVVTAGDGVRVTPSTGPVDANGAHVNLAVTEKQLDNRPAPGGHATEASEVTTYDQDSVPDAIKNAATEEGDAEQIKAAQAGVRAAAEAAGQVEVQTQGEPHPISAPVVENAETPTTPAKAARPASGSSNTKK